MGDYADDALDQALDDWLHQDEEPFLIIRWPECGPTKAGLAGSSSESKGKSGRKPVRKQTYPY